MERMWISLRTLYYKRGKWGLGYAQNTTCQFLSFVHIIGAQEDSISGSCICKDGKGGVLSSTWIKVFAYAETSKISFDCQYISD